ncbi:MAG: carbohydrate kinase family protein [bacterium]
MGQDIDVIVAGLLVADLIGRTIDVEDMPRRGALKLVDSMELHTGGNCSNVGIALAKLGFKVGVIGKIGDDNLKYVIEGNLGRYGIDTQGLIIDPTTNTSATMALVDSRGERTFLHYMGGNAKLDYEDVAGQIDYIRRAKIIHVGYFGLLPALEPDMARLFRTIRQETQITIALDTGGNPGSLERLAPCLEFTDIFIPSFDEARVITGKDTPRAITDAFLERGPLEVVGVKMGEKGCYLRGDGDEHFIPAFDVEAVDATGAGDSFYAGFLAAWLKGWPLLEAGRFGNAVGACCVTQMGASSGIRSFEETQELMRKFKIRR